MELTDDEIIIAAIRNPENNDNLTAINVSIDLDGKPIETTAICWNDEEGLQPMAILSNKDIFKALKVINKV